VRLMSTDAEKRKVDDRNLRKTRLRDESGKEKVANDMKDSRHNQKSFKTVKGPDRKDGTKYVRKQREAEGPLKRAGRGTGSEGADNPRRTWDYRNGGVTECFDRWSSDEFKKKKTQIEINKTKGKKREPWGGLGGGLRDSLKKSQKGARWTKGETRSAPVPDQEAGGKRKITGGGERASQKFK